jgi:hypothetical protein
LALSSWPLALWHLRPSVSSIAKIFCSPRSFELITFAWAEQTSQFVCRHRWIPSDLQKPRYLGFPAHITLWVAHSSNRGRRLNRIEMRKSDDQCALLHGLSWERLDAAWRRIQCRGSSARPHSPSLGSGSRGLGQDDRVLIAWLIPSLLPLFQPCSGSSMDKKNRVLRTFLNHSQKSAYFGPENSKIRFIFVCDYAMLWRYSSYVRRRIS